MVDLSVNKKEIAVVETEHNIHYEFHTHVSVLQTVT